MFKRYCQELSFIVIIYILIAIIKLANYSKTPDFVQSIFFLNEQFTFLTKTEILELEQYLCIGSKLVTGLVSDQGQ